MSKFNYFRETTIDGYDFADHEFAFGFLSQGFALLNTGTRTLEYSFDRQTTHGNLNPSNESKGIIFDDRCESKIWIRATTGPSTIRIEAWGGGGRLKY